MVVGSRAGHQGGDVGGLEGLDDRGRQLQAEVDEVHRAARPGRGTDQVGHLVGAEGDGEVGDHVRPVELAGVDVDARRHVDGHDGHTGPHLERRHRPGPQAGVPADAHDPVDHDVGSRRVGGVIDDAAARRPERGQALLVVAAAEQHRRDPRAATQQGAPGVQRVAAVVPGADEQQDPAAVATAEEVEDGMGEPGRGALHQGAVGQQPHQFGLGVAHLGDGVGSTHAVTLVAGRVGRCQGRAGATGVRSWGCGAPGRGRSGPARRCR